MTTLTTPFLECHKRSGAKLIEFAGFLMPVSYAGIVQEHKAVRTSAGVFDVSHMGEFEVRGKDAAKYVDRLVTNRAGEAGTRHAEVLEVAASRGEAVATFLATAIETLDWAVPRIAPAVR